MIQVPRCQIKISDRMIPSLVVYGKKIDLSDLRRRVFQAYIKAKADNKLASVLIDRCEIRAEEHKKISIEWMKIPTPKFIPEFLWEKIQPKILLFEGVPVRSVDITCSTLGGRSILVSAFNGRYISNN